MELVEVAGCVVVHDGSKPDTVAAVSWAVVGTQGPYHIPVLHDCIVYLFHRVQGLYDACVPQNTMTV